MSRYYIRLIFIGILIFLPLQYALVGIIGAHRSEPWPAFVFPGFKNVFHAEESVTISSATFVALDSAGNQFELEPADILKGIPVSHHGAIMRYQFKRYTIDRDSNTKFVSDEGWEWFQNQIHKNNPQITPLKELYVEWYDRVFIFDEMEISPDDSRLTHRFEIKVAP